MASQALYRQYTTGMLPSLYSNAKEQILIFYHFVKMIHIFDAILYSDAVK